MKLNEKIKKGFFNKNRTKEKTKNCSTQKRRKRSDWVFPSYVFARCVSRSNRTTTQISHYDSLQEFDKPLKKFSFKKKTNAFAHSIK